ncbi:MAG TPA: hypothetical protein VII73_06775 [Caulobacteraceae bacterium]
MPDPKLVHPTAVISREAIFGDDVSVGPFTVIGAAIFGKGVTIHSHAFIGDGVEIGADSEVFPGAVIGKAPSGAGATSRPIEFKPTIEIGECCSIGPHSVIYYDVHIGSGTLIGDGASIREQCRIGQRCIISRYVTINYNTVVGNDVKIMDLTHLTGNMIIDDNVFVSILVGTTNDNDVRSGYGSHVIGPHLEASAVIGVGASLLPNICIGKGATVGAGSVVTKDVKPNTTVLGIPARER